MQTQTTTNSASIDLTSPVGYYARLGGYADSSLTIGALANWLYEQHRTLAAVVSGSRYLGSVSHRSMLRAIERGVPLFAPVTEALDPNVPVVDPKTPVGEVLEILEKTGSTGVEIVDGNGHWLGTFVVSSLLTRKDQRPRPRMVGGMATFGGVYLTNGAIGAGAKWYDLMLVGATMAVLWLVSALATTWIFSLYQAILPSLGFLRAFDFVFQFAILLLPVILFLLGMRLLPIAGVHAAEHKVVHAIERGEPLEPDVVDSMPRVHPRCGTNLVMAMLLFFVFMSIPMAVPGAIQALMAAIFTLMFFRPLGTFAQQYFTTKNPSRKQIEMGIRAGNELLDRYSRGEGLNPTLLSRIWSSGILLILASAAATLFLISKVVAALFQVHLGIF